MPSEAAEVDAKSPPPDPLCGIHTRSPVHGTLIEVARDIDQEIAGGEMFDASFFSVWRGLG